MGNTNTNPSTRRKILFFAEAITLAHIARPLALSQSLPSVDYEIYFATASFPRQEPALQINLLPLYSIQPSQFIRAMGRAQPIYSEEDLHRYVEEDLRLIDVVKPHVVVGDFRISLAISARLRKTPYINIVNAHWSPQAKLTYPIPDFPEKPFLNHKLVRALCAPFGDLLLRVGFRSQARAMNRVRRKYGLPSLPDLRATYTDADYVLFPDPPGFVALTKLPPHHAYIGPIAWSPNCPRPTWWDRVPSNRPIIYLSLGSSGQSEIQELLVETLGELPVTCLVATVGRKLKAPIPSNMLVADFLPGSEVARRASLVICNGGSASVYQALLEGTPVLGLPSNLDQFLTMHEIRARGIGLFIRALAVTRTNLRSAIMHLLDDPQFRQRARQFSRDAKSLDPMKEFPKWVTLICDQDRVIPDLPAQARVEASRGFDLEA